MLFFYFTQLAREALSNLIKILSEGTIQNILCAQWNEKQNTYRFNQVLRVFLSLIVLKSKAEKNSMNHLKITKWAAKDTTRALLK